jgi:hypothetical protein
MEMQMDRKTFKKLMKLLDAETVEILGDAAFAAQVLALAQAKPTPWPLLSWEQHLYPGRLYTPQMPWAT